MHSDELHPHEKLLGLPLHIYAIFAEALDPYRGALRMRRRRESQGIKYAQKEQEAEIRNDKGFIKDFTRLFKGSSGDALDALCEYITKRSTVSSLRTTATRRANLRIVTDAWKIIVSR